MFYTQSNMTTVRFSEQPLIRVTIPFQQPFTEAPTVVVTPFIERQEPVAAGVIATLIAITNTEFVVDLLQIGHEPSRDLEGKIHLNWLARGFLSEKDEGDKSIPKKSPARTHEGGDLTQNDIRKIQEMLKRQKVTTDSLSQMLDRINATHELILKNMR